MKQTRKIAGRTIWDRGRNYEIRNSFGQEPIITKIKMQQINWFYHVARRHQTRVVKEEMEMRRTMTMRRGRP